MPDISATKLARKIINQASMNDDFEVKDDVTCGVIYFREPRKFHAHYRARLSIK